MKLSMHTRTEELTVIYIKISHYLIKFTTFIQGGRCHHLHSEASTSFYWIQPSAVVPWMCTQDHCMIYRPSAMQNDNATLTEVLPCSEEAPQGGELQGPPQTEQDRGTRQPWEFYGMMFHKKCEAEIPSLILVSQTKSLFISLLQKTPS